MERKISISIGDRFKNKEGDWCTVVSTKSAMEITVKFDNTGSFKVVQGGNLRRGTIKDDYKPRVHGVGFKGTGKYAAKVAGKNTTAYTRWSGILARCYNPKVQKNTSYIS